MDAVDRNSPMPLWAQVLDDLRTRLSAGEFGDRFPTDKELTEHYGVSRHTAREAVRHLRAEGVVERERGRGTFVRTSVFEQPLGSIYSLFRSIEAEGTEQRSRVRALDERTDLDAATRLGLPADTRLVHLERVRLADREPLALDRVWLPGDLGRPLLDADFTRTALYDELAARVGVRPVEGHERIRPVIPPPEERRLLGLSSRQAAFEIERTTRHADGPLEFRRTVVRGDRYSFVASWSAGGSVEPRLAPDAPAAD